MIPIQKMQEIIGDLPKSLRKEFPRHPWFSEEETVLSPEIEMEEMLNNAFIGEGGGKFEPGISIEIHVWNKHYSLYLQFTKEGMLVGCFDAINGSY